MSDTTESIGVKTSEPTVSVKKSMLDLISRYFRAKWDQFYLRPKYFNLSANAVMTATPTKNLYHRVQQWLWKLISGRDYFQDGCYQLYVNFSNSDDMDENNNTASATFEQCSDFFINPDHTMTFLCLMPDFDAKANKFVDFPPRKEDETPIAYRQRLVNTPGIEQQKIFIRNYESLIYRGLYRYVEYDGTLMFEMTAVNPAEAAKEKATERASKLGIKVIDGKNKGPNLHKRDEALEKPEEGNDNSDDGEE